MVKTVDLPEELLIEILPRVPAASLARWRSTSKGWNALINALIKDASFKKKHFVNAPRPSLVIMLIGFRLYSVILGVHKTFEIKSIFSLKNPLSNYRKEVDISHVFHCDGLLLCTTEEDNRLVVWNPCSGETSWIEYRIANKKVNWFALGRSSCNNKYKVLRVGNHVRTYMKPQTEYEIYDFTSKSWRVVGETRPDWRISWLCRHGMSMNGNTYWLGLSESQESPQDKTILISFDYSSERFIHVSLPSHENLDSHVLALSVSSREDQKLCLLATMHLDIDMWMATKIDESNGAATWNKIFTVKRTEPHQFSLTCVNGMNFLADLEKKFLACPNGYGMIGGCFLHILGEDTHIKVHNDYPRTKCSVLLLRYVPSLVQIQQVS